MTKSRLSTGRRSQRPKPIRRGPDYPALGVEYSNGFFVALVVQKTQDRIFAGETEARRASDYLNGYSLFLFLARRSLFGLFTIIE